MELLKGLFSGEGGLGNFLGSEMFGNLIKGGSALMGGMQAGDMMDFQKDLMGNAENRTNTLFEQDQEDRERDKNLDFG